jgi:hypothetical protein
MAEQPPPESPEDQAKRVAKEEAESLAQGRVRELVRIHAVRDTPDLPSELQHLAEKQKFQEIERVRQEVDAKRERDKQEVALRKTYANGLLRILTAQLAIADAVFVVFAWAGKNWVLSTAVIDTWLAAVVVQVIGVVTVVTLHLFPRRDRQFDAKVGGSS